MQQSEFIFFEATYFKIKRLRITCKKTISKATLIFVLSFKHVLFIQMARQENKIHLKCASHCDSSLKNKGLLNECLVFRYHAALSGCLHLWPLDSWRTWKTGTRKKHRTNALKTEPVAKALGFHLLYLNFITATEMVPWGVLHTWSCFLIFWGVGQGSQGYLKNLWQIFYGEERAPWYLS